MNAKILVVDDEHDLELLIRQKFRHAIKSGELQFSFALNGVAAMEKLQSDEEYSMIITDINMPEMDGLTLLEHISGMNLPLKTVVISAYGDMGNIRTAMNRGAFDFITKPIDLKDLEVTIGRALKESDAIRQGRAAKQRLDRAILEKEKAEEAKRFEKQFLANMSHEIRTPMNAVIGMTNLVLKTGLDERQRKYVDAVRISAENLLGIINDILDISKIEAGKIDLENIPFSVKDVLGNVFTVLHLKAEEKKLNFSVTAGEQIPPVLLGDPLRITQVLINIVGNAIKFTSEGSVTVSCRVLSQEGDDVLLEFSVHDTGIGIAPDKIDRVFESFTQASSETNRMFGGTGLGLTISRQLVDLMGGKLTASSSPEKGTTFSFTIPLRTGEHAAIKTEENSLPPDAIRNAKLLLVEDNEFNRIVAVDTLKEFLGSVNIDIAQDGKEAVELVSRNTYDLVLMDIQMPGMDGYEATRSIRSMEAPLNQTPILAMTANATPEEVKRCSECGMNGHVAKPFVPENLFRKMAELLEVHNQGRQAFNSTTT